MVEHIVLVCMGCTTYRSITQQIEVPPEVQDPQVEGYHAVWARGYMHKSNRTEARMHLDHGIPQMEVPSRGPETSDGRVPYRDTMISGVEDVCSRATALKHGRPQTMIYLR